LQKLIGLSLCQAYGVWLSHLVISECSFVYCIRHVLIVRGQEDNSRDKTNIILCSAVYVALHITTDQLKAQE